MKRPEEVFTNSGSVEHAFKLIERALDNNGLRESGKDTCYTTSKPNELCLNFQFSKNNYDVFNSVCVDALNEKLKPFDWRARTHIPDDSWSNPYEIKVYLNVCNEESSDGPSTDNPG